jgi:hypothetical protein
METPITTITSSELSAFLECPLKWKFRYKELLVSKKPKSKLNLGTAVHDAIEFFYKNMALEDVRVYQQYALDRFNKEIEKHAEQGGWPPSDEEIEAGRELAQSLIEQYVLYCRRHDEFEVVSLEEEFDLPVINPHTGEEHENLRLLGKIDGWVQHNNHNFMMEHKTGAQFANDWWWKYLSQLDLYIYAMQRKHDVTFKGGWFNGLYKKIPVKPQPLKKGGLSKSKSIVTTPEVYLASIYEHGLDPEDYQDILQILRDKGERFVQREVVYRHPEDIDEIERTIWWAVNAKERMEHFPRRKSDDCGWKCGYKDLCIQDLPELREELYKVKESKHSELSENTYGNQAK